MSKFLEDFLITMPDTQRKKILQLLEVSQQRGLIRSTYELEKELEKLMKRIDSDEGKPTFKARPQSGQTNSQSYNANMEEISFDLATLFEASATIERLMADNKQLSRSLLSNIKKNIYGLQAKLERIKMLMTNTDGFTDDLYEQFNTPSYTEVDEKVLKTFRKDRFGKYLNATYNAENIGDSLQLSGVETIDQLKTNYGRKLANIKVINRTGHASNNPNHEIDKAIDGSLDTYWAESILVDEPITQNINDLWSNDYKNTPEDGAICELEISLNGITTVSDIQFDPFCSYPLEIISIYGYENEDMTGTVHELISPNHISPYQRSQKSVSLMSFQFPSVDIAKIRILLRQENYVKENYIVSQDDLQNQELWRKLSADPELIDDYKQPNETIAEFDQKNEITGWNLYLEKLIEWGNSINNTKIIQSAKKAMETIRMGDYQNPLLLKLRALTSSADENMPEDESLNQAWQAVNKLSYLYGAYNISIFGRKYHNQSIYVTTPLALTTNATRISLETVEKHHDIEIGREVTDQTHGANPLETARITDIEYYVTQKKNPMVTDWHPILPVQKQYVEGELLTGDMIKSNPPEFEEIEANGNTLITYSLRFPSVSDQTLTLRRNGIVMNPNTYVISHDGKKVGIYSKFYSASSMYTVDYKPTDDAWFFHLDESTEINPTQYIDENGETGEYFDKVDQHNQIHLKHKPYLFRNSLFQYNEDTGFYEQDESKLSTLTPEFPIIVRVNGEEYLNITNYEQNRYDEERLKENEGKAFAQIGNQIIFGSPIDNSPLVHITVDYYYVATDIRIKAILRRNSVEDESVTPALYSYHIRCQSYDQEV